MFSHELAHTMVSALFAVIGGSLFPLMLLGFISTVVLKSLVVYTVRRQQWFSREFEKRVIKFTDNDDNATKAHQSFYIVCKRLLERTYYELFEVRGIMLRRKRDYISSPIDRLFAIQHGCAWFVKDTLREIRHLKYSKDNPRFLEISKTVNNSNPCFGRLFGWLPLGPLNDVLNLMPGLFIISGIFGTFLGIMQGLPELGQLDMKDVDASKIVMDTFLLKISFAIGASIMGIFFSVVLSVFYSMVGIEKKYVNIVDVYDRCMMRLWECCDNNQIPSNISAFDEHRDPIEALAAMSLDKEVANSPHQNRFAYPPAETVPSEISETKKKVS